MPVFRGTDCALPSVKNIAVEYDSVYLRNQPVLCAITNRKMTEVDNLEIPTQLVLGTIQGESHSCFL